MSYVSRVAWSMVDRHVENPPAPEGAMGWWLGWHELRWASRGF